MLSISIVVFMFCFVFCFLLLGSISLYEYLYPFTSWWMLTLFPVWGCYKNSSLTYFLTKPWVILMQVDHILRNTTLRLKTDTWKGQVNFQSYIAQKALMSEGGFKSSCSSFLHGRPRYSSVKSWPKTFRTDMELFHDSWRRTLKTSHTFQLPVAA